RPLPRRSASHAACPALQGLNAHGRDPGESWRDVLRASPVSDDARVGEQIAAEPSTSRARWRGASEPGLRDSGRRHDHWRGRTMVRGRPSARQPAVRNADRLALSRVSRCAALRRRPLLGGARLPCLLAGVGDRPQPDSDSALRWIRDHRALAIDRAADPRQPAWNAAAAHPVLPHLAGRTNKRCLLERHLQPDQLDQRARNAYLLRPAPIPPVIGERAETRALQALDTNACIKLAQDLVRVPSVTGNERAVQDLVALTLEEAGLEVDRFEADVSRLKAHPRFPGMEVERTEAVLVAGLLGQTGERSLILNGHVDVVPVGDRQAWHASPWSAHIQAGRLYGRGACDMKAGLAVGISAAAALKKSGLPLRGRLIVQSV